MGLLFQFKLLVKKWFQKNLISGTTLGFELLLPHKFSLVIEFIFDNFFCFHDILLIGELNHS